MSTRATYTFGYVETNVKTKKHAQFEVFHNLEESKLDAFLDNENVTVYKHHDGYPTGALEFINNMLLELLHDYETIGECKHSPKTLAKYFLIENVKMRKESEKIFTDLLGVEPIEINSALVSAQNRKRLYWTNIPNVTQPIGQNILLKDVLENGYVDRDKSHCIDANYWKGGNLKSYFEKHRRQLVFSNHFPKHYRNLSPLECERLQGVPDN
tara:strand:+ start:412 stop:1047 length:636 start_codon:yes stop_codon:yes gene_type:complete